MSRTPVGKFPRVITTHGDKIVDGYINTGIDRGMYSWSAPFKAIWVFEDRARRPR